MPQNSLLMFFVFLKCVHVFSISFMLAYLITLNELCRTDVVCQFLFSSYLVFNRTFRLHCIPHECIFRGGGSLQLHNLPSSNAQVVGGPYRLTIFVS